MKHPNPKIQKNQDELLKNCPESERDFHKRIFRIGNAACRYHQLSVSINRETMKFYFNEWLEGLPANIKKDMKLKGFEACKMMLPFTRYVNERQDIGMGEWMKHHLSAEDYEYYTNSK